VACASKAVPEVAPTSSVDSAVVTCVAELAIEEEAKTLIAATVEANVAATVQAQAKTEAGELDWYSNFV
jgi:hypothetical protein